MNHDAEAHHVAQPAIAGAISHVRIRAADETTGRSHRYALMNGNQ